VDPVALDFYLAYGYVPGARCIYRGVHKLGQGEVLLYDVDADTLQRRAYWRLPESMPDGTSAEDLVEELETLLEGAVRRQLVADVPVGILLSGGIDSSLITAVAARLSQAPVKTFNVSFPGHAGFDESAYARLVARHFRTEHIEIAAQPTSFDLLPLLARQFDEPVADHAIVPTYIVSRLIREHATVALGGDGGDELFGGYPHYSWLMKQERLRRFVPSTVRALASAVGGYLPLGLPGRNHLIGSRDGIANSIAHINLVFDRRTRRALTGGAAGGAEQYRATLADPAQTLLRRAMETDFRSTMVDGYLVKVDRASMLNSLEIRAPFLDTAIIDFAYGLVPDGLKATEHERKILPRMLAARLLPTELDLTRKQGFTMPLASWFRQGWGGYIEDVLTQSELFDRRVVAGLLRNQRWGLRNGHRLFALTMLELWRREHRPSFADPLDQDQNRAESHPSTHSTA
jgi:asparagine synthase (glutamine-hydrolysing)